MDRTQPTQKEKLFPYSKKVRRAGAVAATAALVTIGAGIAATAPEHSRSSSKTAEEANAPESMAGETEKAAQELASQILDLNTAGKDVQSSVTRNDDGETVYSVQISTGKVLGSGNYGRYTLEVTGYAGEDDVISPNEVTSVYVAMDTPNIGDNSGRAGELYGFGMHKLDSGHISSGEVNWNVVVGETTKGADRVANHYVTYDLTGATVADNVHTMTAQDLATATEQAQTVIDWAKDRAPVNYAPHAG